MVWFQVALDIAEIIHYLAHSPLGSLKMADFSKQQFIKVGTSLKRTDADDLVLENANNKCNGKYLLLTIFFLNISRFELFFINVRKQVFENPTKTIVNKAL